MVLASALSVRTRLAFRGRKWPVPMKKKKRRHTGFPECIVPLIYKDTLSGAPHRPRTQETGRYKPLFPVPICAFYHVQKSSFENKLVQTVIMLPTSQVHGPTLRKEPSLVFLRTPQCAAYRGDP
ncbi:TCDD-inducible poly [Platysternon megacephalum]|uniref:TCDD-inducible poly n=1 Tax=Platysternon megacephalum TaxID=55544 RepID=A0A4D9DRH2_9SAUR|nr:TCDD-inducible poly [Platysternon megacephalum]